jgi:outer membrane murein-binding lipoprotein Lpp
MIQDQLVEYVSSQMKLGVSRDAIKSALVGVGWQAIDVEDTLKKVEGDKVQPVVAAAQPQPIAQKPSISVQAASSMPSNTPLSKPSSPFASFSPSDIVGGAKNISSQPIRMDSPVSAPAQNSAAKSFFNTKPVVSADKNVMAKPISTASEYPPKKKGGHTMTIIEAVGIVILAALSCFLYVQNSTLSAKVNGLSGQSSDVTSQIANLNAQVQTFTASDANLNAQVISLMAVNADLQTNLSFLAVLPVGSSSAALATTTTATVSGMLSGSSKTSFVLTTAYGVKVYVKNSSDVGVSAALVPLIGATAQLSGTHLVGSANLTVMSVNGNPIVQNVPPVTPASSTSQNVSSTLPSTASTSSATTTP